MATQSTLRLWSLGPAVKTLQEGLNQVLPLLTPLLKTDGIYGPKTLARVKQFQTFGHLSVDGVVGPKTWELLAAALSGAIDFAAQAAGDVGFKVPEDEPLRNAIANVAHQEFIYQGALIHAVLPGGKDPSNGRTYRKGHQRLLEYFRVAAPSTKPPDTTLFHDDAVVYLHQPGQLHPMPHWCGIFALWVVKTALVNASLGTWQMGGSIYHVAGFAPIKSPKRGDIAVKAQPWQHHAIVHTAYRNDAGQDRIITIDGNSKASSTISRNESSPSDWTNFFKVTALGP
jgi:hypothetical protein